jgi:hypothetical protein
MKMFKTTFILNIFSCSIPLFSDICVSQYHGACHGNAHCAFPVTHHAAACRFTLLVTRPSPKCLVSRALPITINE